MKPFYIAMFEVEENNAVNINFEAGGYETSDFILNSGSVIFVILLALVYTLVTYIFSKLCCSEKVKKYS